MSTAPGLDCAPQLTYQPVTVNPFPHRTHHTCKILCTCIAKQMFFICVDSDFHTHTSQHHIMYHLYHYHLINFLHLHSISILLNFNFIIDQGNTEALLLAQVGVSCRKSACCCSPLKQRSHLAGLPGIHWHLCSCQFHCMWHCSFARPFKACLAPPES